MDITPQKITPFLWFNDNADEAVGFYVSVTCSPKPDPCAMRVARDPGGVQEALEDEADEAHTGTDREQAA